MNDWKITYIDYSGVFYCMHYSGSLMDLNNVPLPHGNGIDSIVRIERVPIDVSIEEGE